MRSRFIFNLVLLLLLLAPIRMAADPLTPDTGPLISTFRVGGDVVLDSVAIDRDSTGATAFLGKASVSIDLGFDPHSPMKGARVHMSLLGTFGDRPSETVEDLQVVNNIEAPSGLSLYEAWVEAPLGQRVSLLVGFHDFNSEFDVIDAASQLLNSSFGIGPEISQLGPSIFPATHAGVRARIRTSADSYLLLGAYDGLSSETVEGGAIENGRHYALETGWSPARGNWNLALGAWRIDDGGDREGDAHNASLSGMYLLAEKTFETKAGRSVSPFLRLGRTSSDCHPIRRYVGAGVRLVAPLTHRPADVLSFGVARADLSRGRFGLGVDGGLDAETTFELTWVFELSDRLAIQPDLQYVDSPALSDARDHAVVGAIRVLLRL